mgnify:CR=1 FL=1
MKRLLPCFGLLIIAGLVFGCTQEPGDAPVALGDIQLVQAEVEAAQPTQPAEPPEDASLFDAFADLATASELPDVPEDADPPLVPPFGPGPDDGFGAAPFADEGEVIDFFGSEEWERIKAQSHNNLMLANRQARVRNCGHLNVILIVIDDLGYGDLGVYGQEMIKTPHIDEFAQTGVRFTNYYSGSSVGIPSHCTLLTGRHTGHCRIRGTDEKAFIDRERTLPEVMLMAGLDTAMFGSWKVGDEKTPGVPTAQGFQESFVDLNPTHARDFYPNYLWRNDRRQPIPGNQNNGRQHYSLDMVTDEAVDYIHRKGVRRNTRATIGGESPRSNSRPFFMMVSLAPPRGNLEDVPTLEPYNNEDWPQEQKQYAAMVSRVDESVGRIIDALYERNMKENTLVILTSDNGPHDEGVNPEFFNSNGPFNGIKSTLNEGGVRVPMIIWGPSDIVRAAGGVSHHVWWAPDLLPTLADLVGAWRQPRNIDGVSQVDLFHGRVPERHGPLYWELHEDGFEQAARLDDWKAIRTGLRGPVRLFNLKEDAGEENDVAADNPDLVRQLAQWMDEERFDSPDWPTVKPPPGPDNPDTQNENASR